MPSPRRKKRTPNAIPSAFRSAASMVIATVRLGRDQKSAKLSSRMGECVRSPPTMDVKTRYPRTEVVPNEAWELALLEPKQLPGCYVPWCLWCAEYTARPWEIPGEHPPALE